jgi:hypothetical protein
MLGALWFLPRASFGQASCTLREAEGSKAPGGIDPALGDVKALLSAPPFSTYPSWKLVVSHPLSLKRGLPERGTLANHHRFEVTFLDRLTEREGRARLRLRLEIRKPDGKEEVSVIVVVDENGAPFPRVEQSGERAALQLIHCKAS